MINEIVEILINSSPDFVKEISELVRTKKLEYNNYPRYHQYDVATNICPECGLDLNQTMGYVCSKNDCPCGLGQTNCST